MIVLKKSICLVGYMGSGKSTIGRELAKEIAVPFVDLDEEIEKGAGKTISEIFRLYGEFYFRKLERYHFRRVLQLKPCIIALGGGTPCFYDNMKLVTSKSRSFYLRLSPKVLAVRLQGETEARPLVHGKSEIELEKFIEAQLVERKRYYEMADEVVDGTGRVVLELIMSLS